MLRAAETTWKTDTGRQRRDNEDNAFARAPVFVVADGMGGAQAGEVASRIAIEAFERGLPESGSPEERLAIRVREANLRIYERSRDEQEHAGMGTTLTAALVDGAQVAIAHVGDSRAYLLRSGSLQRLTQDHSLVDELLRRGKLTEEQAAEHPQRSIITRALGPEPSVEVDTWTYPVREGDVVMLCSDGLTSMLSENQIMQVLSGSKTLETAASDLIREANEAGGRDNITVVLFRLEEVGAENVDAPTIVGLRVGQVDREAEPRPATAVPPSGRAPAAPVETPKGSIRATPRPRERRRYRKPLAAVLAAVIVLFLIGAGGWLATRQLYFIGTNGEGIVTVYRGLPYDLPVGIRLYETFYVSGVPAALVPVGRRSALLNHHLRSQSDASTLVHDLELGKVSK